MFTKKGLQLVLLYFYIVYISCHKSRVNRRQHQHKKSLITTTNEPLTTSKQIDVSNVKPTTVSTTESITLRVGNKTINTNLQSALDDIAPGLIGKSVVGSATYPPNVYGNYYNPTSSELQKNSSNVIFEVIEVEPFLKGHHKYNMKFILVTSLYATTGLACILATYCTVKAIASKRGRHRQYMLLTKRELEFPLGGGGI